MSTPTPTERVQQAQALLLWLSGEQSDFLPVVTMPDDEMATFLYQLGNLLSLVLKTTEVTVKTSEARAQVRAGEISRLRKMAGLVQTIHQ